jgi:acyl dehydratase
MTQLKTVAFRDVQVGDKLPELPIEITSTMVVAGAIASHDFTPVHHDKSAAQAQGMQDVFMNILTTNGLVGRYVTDWAGPNALLKKVAIKLGAPNFPGDTMKMTGVVKAKEEGTGVVDLEVLGRNSWGNHVTAQVRIALPTEA